MFASIPAVIAGLLFGLDIDVIAGALPFITNHSALTSRPQEQAANNMMLGAAIGALFNGWLSSHLGRKYSLMAGAIPLVVGSLGSAFASSVETLILVCVVLGVAVGIMSYTVPLYFFKMVSENARGKMISMYQLIAIPDIVLAFLPDTAFSYNGNRRATFGAPTLPAVSSTIPVVLLPGSSRQLAKKGRHIEAGEALRMLRDMSEKVCDELNEIHESLKLK